MYPPAGHVALCWSQGPALVLPSVYSLRGDLTATVCNPRPEWLKDCGIWICMLACPHIGVQSFLWSRKYPDIGREGDRSEAREKFCPHCLLLAQKS